MELMTYLEKRGVRKGLCTRNFPGPVEHLCEKFMPGVVFGPVVTRETVGVQAKPSAEGVWRCAEVWEAEEVEEQKKKRGMEVPAFASASTAEDATSIPTDDDLEDGDAFELSRRRHLGASVVMVGDSLDDMVAGHRAGAATILLASEETEEELLNGHEYVDLVVRRLDEIVGVLEQGFEGAIKVLDG
jgi:phosphoglycolate phosphatase-like HAD superfamily hydrolase